MNHLNQFDRISWIYDLLTSVFFFGRIKRSQLFFLPEIRDAKAILILGGGTGWILKYILEINSSAKVCYIDASLNMIEKSKKFNNGNVEFIHGTEKAIPDHQKFDAVVTNFYLDLFNEEELSGVVDLIRKSSTINAVWIATDFKNEKWWHSPYLSVMYFFFNVVSSLRSRELPAWQQAIAMKGFSRVRSELFYSSFIESSVYVLKH